MDIGGKMDSFDQELINRDPISVSIGGRPLAASRKLLERL
jgi:hypothetical protein